MLCRKLFTHGLPQGLLTATMGVALLAGGLATQAEAQKGKSGTTLAAVKTIDVCSVDDTTWRYSGEIALWNEGAVGTKDLVIQDCIQNKTSTGQFADIYCNTIITPPAGFTGTIPDGTTQPTALTFKYSIDAAPLEGYIRNIARITITNHSGSLGTPKGPEPKATLTSEVLPCPLDEECGCTYTQGYWGSKPNVVWPDGYARDAQFFLSGQTWQQILDGTAGGNGYFILAHQYIAAVLNQANEACVPTGVQDVLEDAMTWLNGNTQGTDKIGNGQGAIPATGCYVGGSCGTQKDWGALLDDYNNGVYQGGPLHCDPSPPAEACPCAGVTEGGSTWSDDFVTETCVSEPNFPLVLTNNVFANYMAVLNDGSSIQCIINDDASLPAYSQNITAEQANACIASLRLIAANYGLTECPQ
jgi:hypothetical protein